MGQTDTWDGEMRNLGGFFGENFGGIEGIKETHVYIYIDTFIYLFIYLFYKNVRITSFVSYTFWFT